MTKTIDRLKIAGSLIAGFILSIILYIVLMRYLYPQRGPVPRPNFSIKTVVAQSPNMKLTLKSLNAEPVNSSNYKLHLTRNYYEVKMIDKNNKEIYTGRILNKYVIPPPDFSGGEKKVIVKIPDTLTLYLPYFKSVKRMVFLDEQGITKLEIPLDNLQAPK